MIESPLIDEIVSEAVSTTRHQDILEFLRTRFGDVPTDLEARIRSVQDQKVLTHMTRTAPACKDLAAFRESLP